MTRKPRLGVVAVEFDESWVDDVVDAVDRERSFGDVSRDHHLPYEEGALSTAHLDRISTVSRPHLDRISTASRPHLRALRAPGGAGSKILVCSSDGSAEYTGSTMSSGRLFPSDFIRS